LFAIIVSFSYICISQCSVKTHLRSGGIYNNHVISNCPQSVPVKEFWNTVHNWQRYGEKLGVTLFMAPRCISSVAICLWHAAFSVWCVLQTSSDLLPVPQRYWTKIPTPPLSNKEQGKIITMHLLNSITSTSSRLGYGKHW